MKKLPSAILFMSNEEGLNNIKELIKKEYIIMLDLSNVKRKDFDSLIDKIKDAVHEIDGDGFFEHLYDDVYKITALY